MTLRCALQCVAFVACFVPPTACAAAVFTPPAIENDGIRTPLGGLTGDAARGRALIVARDPANCVLCHAVPADVSSIAGNVGPSLVGVAKRMSAAQARLRIVDASRVDPDSVMPPYYRIENLSRVASPYRGAPILSAQQVEDIVAWLMTLQ